MSEALIMDTLSGQEADESNADTRNRLLDAAIRIASRQGLDKVTYRSISAEAGLSHSLVRFYFGTGEEMLTQALERAAFLEATESRILAPDLESFCSEMVAAISAEKPRGLLQYDYLLRAVRGGLPVERVVALYDFYIAQVGGTLENLELDDPDGSFAAMVLATLDGLVLQHSIYGSAERAEAVLERLREVIRLFQANQTL